MPRPRVEDFKRKMLYHPDRGFQNNSTSSESGGLQKNKQKCSITQIEASGITVPCPREEGFKKTWFSIRVMQVPYSQLSKLRCFRYYNNLLFKSFFTLQD